jgi:hypothetical protein
MTTSCPSCKGAVTVPDQGAPPPPQFEVVQQPLLKKAFVFVLGTLSALYLFNPSAGIFELIPDNIPLIGNLDEVMATLLLVRCLSYFGVDLTGFIDSKTGKFKRNPPK